MMRDKIANFFAGVPTSIAGLALAIASLGWCWEGSVHFGGQLQMLGALLASPLLLLLLLATLFNPQRLTKDLSHHISGSALPTFCMALMMIANAINEIAPLFSLWLWFVSIALHLLFLLFFCYYRLQAFTFEHLLPSWFIPPVGIVVASISLPESGGGAELIAHALLLFGLAAYVILLPAVLYRYFMLPAFTDSEKPTTALFAAPASLILAGYLTICEQPNMLFVGLLAILAVTMTLFVYFSFNKLLRLPFSPGYSAFTFPLVIGATAMFKMQQYLLGSGASLWLSELVGIIAYGELVIATLMIAYVCLRYIAHFNPFKTA